MASESTGLGDSASAPDPELIAVFELVGTVAGFVRATKGIEGLRFLTDFAGEGLEPDDDFYYRGEDDDASDDGLPQALYLVMASARAIDELIRLFGLWQEDQRVKFEQGLAPLKAVFSQLHTIRRWGPEDRVRETGLLDQWRDDLELTAGTQSSVLVEIELVWGQTPEIRAAQESTIRRILTATRGAALLASCVIESISYHGVLAELPHSEVKTVLRDGPGAIAILVTGTVLFVSKAEPMSVAMETGVESGDPPVVGEPPAGEPRVALLDGVPLAKHRLLVEHLRIDDPDGRESAYTARKRRHGTAMASLIIHGDLARTGRPLASPIHVHPILVPHEVFEEKEVAPPRELFIDVVHRAFQRMFGGPKPSAQSVRIVNLSIGEPARAFARRLSPLARLLDYLAVEFNLLIIVSGGNHNARAPVVPAAAIDDPDTLARAVRAHLQANARQRRLLSPADSINALTVGAVHDDGVETPLPDGIIDPLPRGSIALYSPIGFGFKSAPKPEVHAPGGRSVVQRPLQTNGEEDVELHPAATQVAGPGLRVAAPTASGSLSGTLHTYGTSNAAALVSHRAGHLLHGFEDHLPGEDESSLPDAQYHPVLLKAMLVHATAWEPQAWGWAQELGVSGNNVRRLLSQQLGFGVLDPGKVGIASPHRVCLVGAGSIKRDERHSFEFPLPTSLASRKIEKRLTITLAWLSPVEPTTQQYRMAHLEFESPRSDLCVEPRQVVHYANGKGTVLHEVLEGDRAAAFVEGAMLAINVDCRVRVGRLSQSVRFGLAVSLEVAPGLEVDLHQEVRERLAVSVRERARTRVGR